LGEGTLPLNGSLKILDTLYNRGLREPARFWPAGNHTSHVLGLNRRLTRFGLEIIESANRSRALSFQSPASEAAFFRNRNSLGTEQTFVEGIGTIAGMPLFTQDLVGRGFSDRDIRKILGLSARSNSRSNPV